MELGGEVLAGLFFSDLSGPQFALPGAIRQLERLEPRGSTFWIAALDPASPCGLGLALDALPQRRGGNHLGYADGELAIVAEANARRLTILLEPDDARLDLLLPNLDLLARARKRLTDRNGQTAYRHGKARTCPRFPATWTRWRTIAASISSRAPPDYFQPRSA